MNVMKVLATLVMDPRPCFATWLLNATLMCSKRTLSSSFHCDYFSTHACDCRSLCSRC
jgi:hypothetical protein